MTNVCIFQGKVLLNNKGGKENGEHQYLVLGRMQKVGVNSLLARACNLLDDTTD